MEEDDDDFYGGGGGVKQEEQADDSDDKAEKMDMSDDEEEDSDDDVQFTLEKPEGSKSEPATKQQSKQPQSADSKPTKSSTPIKPEARASSTAPPPQSSRSALTHNGKEGKDFPEIRTSKIDINGHPSWPGANKPITAVDIDADLAESSKPWRLPGTDITDFFNYGFDEYTWVQYCLRQQTMTDTISDQRKQDAQMKAMFGGGPGGGGMPGMPPGMDGMPGPDQFMQMMQSGAIPPEMAAMMGMPPGMGQGQFGGQGQQGGGFGSGQNSASPNPQPGQGFQPPSGPGGFQGGGNIEGYSPQQLAIMQQEQQGGFQQGGRGRGKRGRW